MLNFVFRSEAKQGQYLFDIPTVANSIGITAIDLSNQLQNLKVDIVRKQINFSPSVIYFKLHKVISCFIFFYS